MVKTKKNINEIVWMIGGEAGFGIQSAGHYFALSCKRGGLNVFGSAEYPSLICGGHNSACIRVSEQKIGIHRTDLNLLVAMNKETLELHAGEVIEGGGIICDEDFSEVLDKGEIKTRKNVKIFVVPLKKLALKAGKSEMMRNTVGIGASFGILNYDLEIYLNILREMFSRKGEVIVEANLNAAREGYDFVKNNFDLADFGFELKVVEREKAGEKNNKIMVTGNDMLCMAALKAGCKFVAEYPMTPSSSVLHFMSKMSKDFNVIVKHAEDELAAMNMVVGAGWAGVRSMTATSGGGFSLMAEAIGMAGMIEVPAVIYEAQRGGPSTGLPTRTEQSDLRFVLHASQGEFPRVVIAPSDFNEMFFNTFEAFNLAEKFQLPVIIMADKHLAESIRSVNVPEMKSLKIDRGWYLNNEKEIEKLRVGGYQSIDDGFLRYKFEKDGISPRVIPGVLGGRHRSATDEHDETGDLTETEENRNKMQAKRMEKLITALASLDEPKLVGPDRNGGLGAGEPFSEKEASATFVSWGSPKEAILEAMQMLLQKGIKTNLLIIKYLLPFHSKAVSKLLKTAPLKINIEMNYEGQIATLISEKCGIFMDESILKWSGRQFTADEIFEKSLKIIKKK